MKQKQRVVRPVYVMLEDFTKFESTRLALLERERALALEAVLINAPELGMEGALKKFGDALLPTEHKLLLTLTKEELKTLQTIKAKVGNLFGVKEISINIQ